MGEEKAWLGGLSARTRSIPPSDSAEDRGGGSLLGQRARIGRELRHPNLAESTAFCDAAPARWACGRERQGPCQPSDQAGPGVFWHLQQ